MAKKHYVWDPEIDAVIMETDENHDPTVTYDVEPEHYGRVVAQHVDGETQTLHFDALGSTREITDETETVVGANLYDAWGVNLARTGLESSRREWVGELGYDVAHPFSTISARRRSYLAAIGRWSTADPSTFVDGPNVYAYVLNSPIIDVDPSGLEIIWFEFNAFIPSANGRKLKGNLGARYRKTTFGYEPGQNPFTASGAWMFKTDSRTFGGGSSRLSSRGWIDSERIGEEVTAKPAWVGARNTVGESTRVRERYSSSGTYVIQAESKTGRLEQDVRTAYSSGPYNRKEPYPLCRTRVRFEPSAGYPFATEFISPNIDYDVTFSFIVVRLGLVEVRVAGVRDNFPAYEAIVQVGNGTQSLKTPLTNGKQLYEWGPKKGSGPGVGNLNTWTGFSGQVDHLFVKTNRCCFK